MGRWAQYRHRGSSPPGEGATTCPDLPTPVGSDSTIGQDNPFDDFFSVFLTVPFPADVSGWQVRFQVNAPPDVEAPVNPVQSDPTTFESGGTTGDLVEYQFRWIPTDAGCPPGPWGEIGTIVQT